MDHKYIFGSYWCEKEARISVTYRGFYRLINVLGDKNEKVSFIDSCRSLCAARSLGRDHLR